MRKGNKMKSMTRQEIVNASVCPACGAGHGVMCWTSKGGGKFRRRVHPARANVATGGKFNGKKRRAVSWKPSSGVLGKEFYESWEWKEARFLAIKANGRRCQCCGWRPGDTASGHLVVDHIKPLRTHPHLALDPSNHQVLCNDCNMGKSYKHTDDFRGQ